MAVVVVVVVADVVALVDNADVVVDAVVVVVDDEAAAEVVDGAATAELDVDDVVDVTLVVVVAATPGMLASDAINADSVTPRAADEPLVGALALVVVVVDDVVLVTPELVATDIIICY